MRIESYRADVNFLFTSLVKNIFFFDHAALTRIYLLLIFHDCSTEDRFLSLVSVDPSKKREEKQTFSLH